MNGKPYVTDSDLLEQSETVTKIPLSLIDRPKNPMRTSWDEDRYNEIKESIKELGVQTPICVRPTENHRYEVVYGDTRRKICIELGLPTIPAVIRNYDDKECAIARATENFKREDVTAIDEGLHFQDLMENAGFGFEDLSTMVGKSESYVRQRLEAAGWEEEIRQAVEEGEVQFSVAREISRVKDPLTKKQMLNSAKYDGATVRKIVDWKNAIKRSEEYIAPPRHERLGEQPELEPEEGRLLCDVCGQLHRASHVHMIHVCELDGGKDVIDWLRSLIAKSRAEFEEGANA